MPPPGARQPDAAAVDALMAWLENSLDAPRVRRTCRTGSCCTGSIARNTRTRFAICWPWTSTPSAVLPADDVAEGFDNIAAALQVSPSFIEQYVIAARAVAVKAMGRPDARPGGWTFRAGPGTQLTHVPGLPLGTRGGILAKVDLPSDGEYIVDVADMATHIWGNGMEFENPLVVTLDNKVGLRDGDRRRRGHEALRSGAERRARSRQRPAEEHQVLRHRGAAQDWRDVQAADVCRVRRSAADVRARRRPGRLYRVNSFQVRGPFNAKGISATPSRERIFGCTPARAGPKRDAQAALRQTDHLDAGEARLSPARLRRGRQRAVPVLRGRREGGGFEDGVRSAITGLLASPFFLYRGERVPAGLRPGRPTRSAISSWRRSCRSSSGTRSPTTSCCSWPSTAS